MDNKRNSHFAAQSEDTHDFFTNKLRVGIMLDTWCLTAWEYTMLEAIISSDYASLELVILNENRDEREPGADKIPAHRNTFLYSAYTKLEERISQPHPAFFPRDAENLLRNVPRIGICPESDGNYDSFQEQDSEKIKGFNLDVIVRRGFRILKGDILTAAKYGVWSYHHDDTTVIRGGPPGFWETFGQMSERGVELQILTEDEDNGKVLCRSFLSCNSFFVSRNNNDCFLKSSLFVPRTLKRLHDNGEKVFLEKIGRENKKFNVYNHRVYTCPDNPEFAKMVIKYYSRMGMNFLSLLFYHNQWLLMYDLKDQISTSFWRFKKIIPPKDRFWADPQVFFRDDRYYIFFEEYPYKTKKAHISLIEMDQSGNCTDPIVVLNEPFHLSYPHVFEYKDTLYMTPETHCAKSIRLYECTQFPTEWKLKTTLVDSIEAVDPTILFHKDTWWMFANVAEPQGTSLDSELYLFYSDDPLSPDWKRHPMNPVISDFKRARPAGKIIERNGVLYRPSQCCSPWYGYGIKLNEIVTLTKDDYAEREVDFIEPKWDRKLKGVHTLCHENRLTMIDGYYNKFRM